MAAGSGLGTRLTGRRHSHASAVLRNRGKGPGLRERLTPSLSRNMSTTNDDQYQPQNFNMNTYSNSDTAPLMMNQVDAELGYSGGPALMQQQPATVTDDTISGADLRAMHGKGDTSLILAIISFIGCFFCTLCVYGASMICHIPAMLFAAKSRVSAEKKDYYDSKLMLHWSYICTFAGCFLGCVLFAVVFISSIVLIIAAATAAKAI